MVGLVLILIAMFVGFILGKILRDAGLKQARKIFAQRCTGQLTPLIYGVSMFSESYSISVVGSDTLEPLPRTVKNCHWEGQMAMVEN